MSSCFTLRLSMHRFLPGTRKISSLVAIPATPVIVSTMEGILAIRPRLMSLRMDRAEQVRQILSTRGLSLYRVSQQSAEIFGRSSRFYVPHSLYYDVADPSLIPTIHQMLALSHITNYRLYDWLAVFGFDLDHISRLQLLIPRQRTTLLDSSVYDAHAWIPWFADRPNKGPVPPIAPVGQFLASARPKRAAELLALSKRSLLYAKVGEADVHALSNFVPGSIVRV